MFTGVDVVERENCAIPRRMYDGTTLPFAADAFDYVMFVDVLHHTTLAEDLLLQAKRVARRGIVIKDHYCERTDFIASWLFMDWLEGAVRHVAPVSSLLSVGGMAGNVARSTSAKIARRKINASPSL